MTSTFDLVLAGVARAIAPLTASLSSPARVEVFVNSLGWELPAAAAELSAIGSKVDAVVDKLDVVLGSTPEEQEDETLMLGRYADLLLAVSALLADLPARARALAATPALTADYLAKTQIEQRLPARLVDHLLISYVEQEAPLVFAVLLAAGVFEVERIDADASLYQTDHVRRTVRLDRLGALFADDRSLLGEVYGWGTSTSATGRLVARLGVVLEALGGRVTAGVAPRALEEALLGRAVPEATTNPVPQLLVSLMRGVGSDPLDAGVSVVALRPGTAGNDDGFAVSPYLRGTTTFTVPLSKDGRTRLEVETTLDVSGGVVVALRPRQGISVRVGFSQGAGGGSSASGGVGAHLRHEAPPDHPLRLLSLPGGSRVEASGLEIGGGVEASSAGTLGGFVQGEVADGRVIVSAAGFDSFLSTLLKDDIEIELDLQGGWSSSRGLFFSGGAGLEITLAVNKTLGPFRLDSLLVALKLQAAGLRLEVSASGGGQLGPVAVAVERVGLAAVLRFERGNLGPAQLEIVFKPPAGLGIVVEAGPVTGGGFISFDPDNGRYAGVLELSIVAISIKAIGLLDTRLPGGRPGFSFLLIISAEFSPIQLGFGFTLNGVGGLAGINRGLAVEPLRAGIRAHSVDRILFPEDPVRDAAQIISDLRTIFPPVQGRYVFGPMAIIGYGTPTILEAEIGIILELPQPFRLVLLGQVNAALPQAEETIVELHLDVLGVLDFGAQTLSLDASLHDSRIAAFNVFGDMALRLSWGAEPNFAVAVGGFHPAYRAPPNFPELRRLTVALGEGDNPRLTMQAYLALTSNTFQVGARAELYAESAGFNVIGWVGFDALFIFSPFSFQTGFSAGFALRRGESVIAAIHLEASLTGPSPFHVRGQASITILFFEISISVDATFGEKRRVEAPIGDPWIALRDEIAKLGNWSASLPPASFRVVSLAPAAADDDLRLVDPLGGLTLRQKVVPLGRTVSKFGESVLPTSQRFVVRHDLVRVGGRTVGSLTPVQDLFAPAQFETLSDQARLSRPSFERMDAGISLASDAVAFTGGGGIRGLDAVYETKTIDARGQPPTPVPGTYTMTSAQQMSVLGRAAAAQSGPLATGLERFAPAPGYRPRVRLAPERFVAVDAETLSVRSDVLGEPTTKGAAYQGLETWLASNPHERGLIVVVPTHELGVPS